MHRHRPSPRLPTPGAAPALALLLVAAGACSTVTDEDPPPAPDTTPPALSNGMPTGMLEAGTTEATLSLETNEEATCTYSEEADEPYPGAVTLDADPSGTTHTAVATGLESGEAYTFYVRCADAAGNATTTDFVISFSVATSGGGGGGGDTTPPVLRNGAPRGTLPAGTTVTTLSLETDEAATCRYSETAGVSYGDMSNTFATTGGTTHDTDVDGLQIGQNTFYVRCSDADGNANGGDFPISFSVASGGGGGPITGVRLASGAVQNVTSVQTPSISPEPNALLLLWVSQANAAGGTSVATATGNNLQWELVTTSVRSPTGPRRVSVLRAMSSSPTPGSVTINMGGMVEEAIWSITQHTGVAVAGTNGSGAIAQFDAADADDFETSALVTLDGSTNDGSATVGTIFSGAAEAMTPGSGFQELSQEAIGISTSGSFWLLVEFASEFDATVDATWSTPAHWVAIGIELQTP